MAKREWGRRRVDNQPYPKTRGKENLPRGLQVVGTGRRKRKVPREMRVVFEGGIHVAKPPTKKMVEMLLNEKKADISVFLPTQRARYGTVSPEDITVVGVPQKISGRDNVPFWRARILIDSIKFGTKARAGFGKRAWLIRPRAGSIHKPTVGRLRISL